MPEVVPTPALLAKADAVSGVMADLSEEEALWVLFTLHLNLLLNMGYSAAQIRDHAAQFESESLRGLTSLIDATCAGVGHA